MANLLNDDQKHLDVESDELKDAESSLGSEVASGSDEVDNVDDIDASMGIYGNDEENPTEVNIAEEIERHNEG